VNRKIRRLLEVALPVAGMGVIFGSVLYGPSSLQLQVLFVLFGILILEAGVWGLANRLLPDERRYIALREEVDHFIVLVPQLNAAAVAKKAGTEDDSQYRNLLEQMHASVKRMGEVAAVDALASDASAEGSAGEANASATDPPAAQDAHDLDTAKTQ
jgi:hypothetical protein